VTVIGKSVLFSNKHASGTKADIREAVLCLRRECANKFTTFVSTEGLHQTENNASQNHVIM